MAGFVKVGKTTDIKNGSMKGFTVAGKQILVANVDGKFYAVDAICSHSFGYLPKGKLSGHIVTCPVHQAQFDLASGRVVKNVNSLIRLATGGKGASDLTSYQTKVEGEDILIKV